MSLKSLRACAFVYYNRHSLHLANEACLLDAAAAVVTEFTTSLECQSPESKIWYAAVDILGEDIVLDMFLHHQQPPALSTTPTRFWCCCFPQLLSTQV